MTYDFLLWVLGLCADLCVSCPLVYILLPLPRDSRLSECLGWDYNAPWGKLYSTCAMAEACKDRLVQSQLDLSVELVKGSYEVPVSSNISSSVP